MFLSLTYNSNKKSLINDRISTKDKKESKNFPERLFTAFIIVMSLSFHCYGQKTLPSSVIHDFAVNAYRDFNYGNGNLRAMLTYSLSKHGYGPFDVALGVEELEKDKKFRNHVFEVLFNALHGDHEFMKVNFLSMGMKASNAKILAKYLIDTYAVTSQDEQITTPSSSQISKDTFIRKSPGPKYVYPGSK